MPGDVVEAGLQSGSWTYLLQKSKKEGKYKHVNTENGEASWSAAA
jgi:hypothetical protein